MRRRASEQAQAFLVSKQEGHSKAIKQSPHLFPLSRWKSYTLLATLPLCHHGRISELPDHDKGQSRTANGERRRARERTDERWGISKLQRRQTHISFFLLSLVLNSLYTLTGDARGRVRGLFVRRRGDAGLAHGDGKEKKERGNEKETEASLAPSNGGDAASSTFSAALCLSFISLFCPSFSLFFDSTIQTKNEQEDAHAVSLRVPSSKKAALDAAVGKGAKTGKKGGDGGDAKHEPEKNESSDDDSSIPTAFFAVFDGHGGKEVAKYAAEHMVEEIAAAPELAAAKEEAAAAKSSGGAPDEDDKKATAAVATSLASASAPLPQSGPLPDAASKPARLLAATLERAFLSTDVRVCAPEARRELAAFAAGGRDGEEEEEEEIGRGGGGGEDVASRAETALSLLLGGRGGGAGGAGGGAAGSGGGASVGGLSPAMVAALAEAGVQVRVARARRSRLEVEDEEEEGDDEDGEEEEGEEEGGKGKGKAKNKKAAASAQRPPHSHKTHATLDIEETEDVTISAAGGSGSGIAGPPGAAKRKRPAKAAAAAALPSVAKTEGEEEEKEAAGPSSASTAADKGNASGVKPEEEEEEEEVEEMEADDDEEEEEESDDDDDDDDEGRPLPFARGGGGLAGLFGGGNRGPPARLPDDAPTTEYDPRLGGRYIGPSAGCTAVSALVRGDQLAVANAGDSRAVLCRKNGRALPLTRDHKPTEEPELGRILAAGGFVADGRVNGSLNLSRALGDAEHKQSPGLPPQAQASSFFFFFSPWLFFFFFSSKKTLQKLKTFSSPLSPPLAFSLYNNKKQAVTCAPDLSTVTLLPGDEFLLLCCDGIWDVLTCQEAVDFVRERLTRDEMSPAEAASALCDRCLAPDTGGCGKGCDNMSAMVSRWLILFFLFFGFF